MIQPNYTTPSSIFADDSQTAFGLGSDKRKSTITYAQAMEIISLLNKLGIYGDLYVNQEGFNAQFVPADPTSTEELIYVLHYAGDYHELAEVAVTLDKTPRIAAIQRLFAMMNIYSGAVYNLPTVNAAVNDALSKLY